MSDLLGIGLSGLRTSRNNISVTGHNISNIDTPGYSRQRAVQVTNPAMGSGAGFFGSGSRTQTVERIIDQYTIHQVRVDTSRFKDHEAYLRNASELDNVLSNENSALGKAINGFFEGMQSAANDPLSKPARQLAFSQADSVSQRFKTAQARLTDQNNNLNTQLRTYTSKINQLSTGIGELNKQILVYEGTRNQPPNDLFDRRDELLRELSEIVDVNVEIQDGLNVHVSIGNGIPLITGENINKLEAVPGRNDKGRYELYAVDSRGSKMHITNEIAGGEMGGIIRYRSETLDPALDEMGRIALVFAGEVNNQHQAGTDLNGNKGGNLFKDINTDIFQKDRIVGIQRDAPVGVWIDPNGLNKLSAQEFHLKQEGNNLVLKDSVTGANTNPAVSSPITGTGTAAEIQALNDELQAKFGFRLTDGSTPADSNTPSGDIALTTSGVLELIQGGGLLISPVRIGASQLERSPELSDTDKIALAGIASGDNNTGTAKLGYVSFNDGATPPSPISLKDAGISGYQISYDGTNYSVLDSVGNLVLDNGGAPFNPTLIANAAPAEGGVLTITDADGAGNDLVINVSNNDTQAGDAWALEGSAGGLNGKALASLQLAKLVERDNDGSGGSSLGETYSMLVEQIGIRTSESRTAAEVGKATLNQSIAMRESASGVNMDEEAGNLIRFQQAYMASTQVISTAQKLFDTLLASVGR